MTIFNITATINMGPTVRALPRHTAVPGRARFRIVGARPDADLGDRLALALESQGDLCVRALNPWSRSVLVTYAPERSLAEVQTLVEGALTQACAAPRAVVARLPAAGPAAGVAPEMLKLAGSTVVALATGRGLAAALNAGKLAATAYRGYRQQTIRRAAS